MHTLFFSKIMACDGLDIIVYVKSWWHGDVDLTLINNTCIMLIPKCTDPKCMSEFRPISLCNVLYKIISKILANKLKPFLDSVISQQQSAFVPKCLIIDSVVNSF